jgi:hypothetical protein
VTHVDVPEPGEAVDDRPPVGGVDSDALPAQDQAGARLLVGPELGDGVDEVPAVEIFEEGVF